MAPCSISLARFEISLGLERVLESGIEVDDVDASVSYPPLVGSKKAFIRPSLERDDWNIRGLVWRKTAPM